MGPFMIGKVTPRYNHWSARSGWQLYFQREEPTNQRLGVALLRRGVQPPALMNQGRLNTDAGAWIKESVCLCHTN